MRLEPNGKVSAPGQIEDVSRTRAAAVRRPEGDSDVFALVRRQDATYFSEANLIKVAIGADGAPAPLECPGKRHTRR